MIQKKTKKLCRVPDDNLDDNPFVDSYCTVSDKSARRYKKNFGCEQPENHLPSTSKQSSRIIAFDPYTKMRRENKEEYK
jgi:hypothetical protein